MLGGASNPVGGSNPSGTGTILNFVGDFAYAHSGILSVNNVKKTLIDFVAPSGQLLVARFQFYYIENQSEDYSYQIEMNGEVVAGFIVDSAKAYQKDLEAKLIVAPETRVIMTAQNVSNTNTREQGATVTARLY